MISGGVSITDAQVTVGGDLVGRDKIVQGYTADQVSSLITQISATFQPKPFDGRCPYLGLDAFSEDDADRFFGREALVNELVARVRDSRFVITAGPSGSGKSSVVRAGLIHALKHNALPDSDRWLYATLTPGRAPIEALALALSRLAKAPDAGDYVRQHSAEFDALHQLLESQLGDDGRQRAVIFVDQFEEVFTQVPKDEDRLAFVNLLTHAATIEGGRVTVLFAMRSDFVSNCAMYPQLNALLNHQFLQVGAMQPDELVSAIARPALQVGLRIDPDLIAQIANEMRDEPPGALPLMQFALKDLFDAQLAKGGVIALTLNDYLARGGLRKSLERHADAAFAALTGDEQQLARAIFSGLIEIGRGTPDTRRIALLGEVIPSGVAADRVQAVVQKLTDARLITTDEQGDKDTLTIAHERLIEAWPWLHRLVNENRDAIALQNQIAEDANEWDDSRRDASYLYSGARLANAREQLAAHKIVLSGLAQAFVEASVEAEEAERRQEEARRQKELDDARVLAESEKQRAEEQARSAARLRRSAVYLIGALGIAVLLGIAAGMFGVQSNQTANANATLAAQNAAIAGTAQANADRAVRSERVARTRQLIAQSQTVFEAQPLLGVRLGLEALALAPVDDVATQNAAARLVIDQAATGRSSKVDLNTTTYESTDAQSSSYFVSYQSSRPTGLWRVIDGQRLVTFTNPVDSVRFSLGPDPRYLAIHYGSGISELRRTLDGTVVFTLPNQAEDINHPAPQFSPDQAGLFYQDSGDLDTGLRQLRWSASGSPVLTSTHRFLGVLHYIPPIEPTLFIASFENTPYELRRMIDGSLIAQLPSSFTSIVVDPRQNPAYFFVIDGDPDSAQPGQLRQVSDGQLVEQLPAQIRKTYFSPDPTARYFLVDYGGAAPNELRYTADGTRALTLTNELIDDVIFDPNPNAVYFGVQYHTRSELRRMSDGRQVAVLDERQLTKLSFSSNPSAPYFVTGYGLSQRGELRRVSDASFVTELPYAVYAAYFSPNPDLPYFLIMYENAPSEIRRVSDGAVVDTTAAGAYPYFSRLAGAKFFIIDRGGPDWNAPGELRSAATGQVSERLPDTVNEVYFPDTNVPYFLIRYTSARPELRDGLTARVVFTLPDQINGLKIESCISSDPCLSGPYLWLPYESGDSELWEWTSIPHRIADLGTGVFHKVFDPSNRQLFVHYGDGRAYFLDLDWLSELDDKAASMPLEKLTRVTCLALAAHRFDEAVLKPYLGDQPPQACR
jgi:hypothetical protein